MTQKPEFKVDLAKAQTATTTDTVEKKLEEVHFPDFINEYFETNLAPSTKKTRIYAIKDFLDWLLNNSIINKSRIQDITLEDFGQISTQDIEEYWGFLLDEPKESKHNDQILAAMKATKDKSRLVTLESQLEKRSQGYVTTQLNANRALFTYLKKVALKKGGDSRYSAFKISPWEGAEAPVYQQRENVATKRARIMDQMYTKRESLDLFNFMRNGYLDTIDTKTRNGNDNLAYQKHMLNLERNIALFALLEFSGMRISEALSISVDQVDLDDLVIKNVQRKENVRTDVNIQASAVGYLKDYLDVRREKYLDAKYEGYDDPFVYNALFLSIYQGRVRPLTANGARTIIHKYSSAFGKATSPHKFRHSFTTGLLDVGASVTEIQQALGQTTSSATEVYMHSSDEEQRRLLDAADKLE
ncbi:site-specific recombinase XerD [Weissella uvarum]|uniref:tyrosine-type recombinase/integrase n=1 Tax=Weissella uvarum TaxID=1479233 RepID=UPI0019600BAB|nr:tyrosine-type recombinase/integrase [Weissella uvarum]MBM7617938.1 site-specific recombinase XerD [Weissella uvarum]MCM0595249.1 tyrosine-type recombinase/integrase [Weissella uvarum]